VSIGRRFVELVRSNINALFERSSAEERRALEELSDEELERELERRRARRDAAERAASRPAEQEAWDEVEQAMRDGSRYRTSGRRTGSQRRSTVPPGGGPGRRPLSGAAEARITQLYAQLECPYGADLTTVRKHYRALMLKYHPDMHSRSTEKQRLATELSQRLTAAYNELRRALSGPS
jgi:hypothetical protein